MTNPLVNRQSTRWSLVAALACLLASSAALAVVPKEPDSQLSSKEFFKPELYISNAVAPIDAVVDELPNASAWGRFRLDNRAASGDLLPVFIDRRSGTATNVVGAFPVIPGRGVGNEITLEDLGVQDGKVDSAVVVGAVLDFVIANRAVIGVDLEQIGVARAVQVTPELWQVSFPQSFGGIPVRHGRLVASINNGNLVVLGTETWGNVRGLSPQAGISADEALAAGFAYADGRLSIDEIVRRPQLEIVPLAVEGSAVGKGYEHLLVWSFAFTRPPEDAVWEVLVDAASGEVLAFQDLNEYAAEQITGGVYPITSTEICPTPDTCGTMQSGWPMPWADTGLAAPNDFTNSGGIFDYPSGTATTTLSGQYVNIVDNCGAISESAMGAIDLGGANGEHDCVTPAGASAGNTASSRSAFYEVNKIAEQARGWLPANTWLQSQLNTEVNINNTCNAFYSGIQGDINFYRSGGGCRNTGEIAGVFDHEWGHALDDNDSGGSLSNTSEAYADIAMLYRLHASCIGHGFWWTSNRGCGMTADGTGFNANEAQVGAAHCDTDCSGVRDADWAKHADNTPDTALGFVCNSCSASSGPCGRQVHCAAAPPRQAAWDLVARDLPGAGFSNDTSFIIGNRLFYQGSGNIGLWYNCACGSSSDGCGAGNAYMQWVAADDDNGNLGDGTPHMQEIFAAFNRHGIACSSPTPTNGGCGAGNPTTAPTLVATPGTSQVSLSWGAVADASEYWVFRTEGVAGCDFGKVRIAEVSGTSYADTEVAGGREYYYSVVAAGASSACFTQASNCEPATPTPPDQCGNGVCDAGEDCFTCAPDCPSFPEGGGTPGNGICEAGDGETCYTTSDCNGQTSGKPANRFCCGFDADESNPYAPDGCGTDSTCNSGGKTCTETPTGGGGTTCCGDGICEAPEDAANCAIDCPVMCIPPGGGQPCTSTTDCCTGVGNCTGGKPSNRVCQ